MAQTGYTPILIYSTSTASAVPLAGNLTNSTLGSELAINITDGKLFYKDNANAVQVIGWKTTPTSAGGTGLTSYTAGDLLYYATGTTLSKLAIGASGRYLSSSGTAPQWSAPGALTETDDTNVTMTLGGSPSTALLSAVSMTLGWTGTLAVSRGGTGTGTAGITAFNNITGYTASGATGTTSTNLVFSTSPTLTTPKATTTIGVGNATAAASGAGITFPGTQSASTDVNTLDDYEEGTFDVTLTLGSGTATLDYVRLGYTKIGRTVLVTGEIRVSAVSTPSGSITMGNLPFVNSGNSQRSSRTIFYVGAGTFTGSPTGVVSGSIEANASTVVLQLVNNFSFGDLGSYLQANTFFRFNFHYDTTT